LESWVSSTGSQGGIRDAGQQHGGTGLGLALVRRLVALHGGAVTLHSRLGQGATFVVTLPRRGTRATRS
jgi:signal transduction histidine kinase